MSDLRAAAYEIEKYSDGSALRGKPKLTRLERHALTLARHILATHHADDGEAITNAWWLSVSDGECRIAICDEVWLECYAATVHVNNGGSLVALITITTRGQLRRLCAALRGEG